MRRKALVTALVLAAALVVAAAAYASFTRSASATQSVSTNTLQPPTAVVATLTSTKCSKPQQVTVTWTASASAFVTGYTVQRNGTTIATLAATATSYVDNAPAHTTQYTYSVVATYQQWSAGSSATAMTC